MSDKPIRIPGPDHPITIAPHLGRIIVKLGDKVLADTRAALTLREASYGAVQYIPRADTDMSLLERSDHRTYCPYKGDAAYYSFRTGGGKAANAVWTYETPYAAVKSIEGHLAFYPDRVEIVEEAAA